MVEGQFPAPGFMGDTDQGRPSHPYVRNVSLRIPGLLALMLALPLLVVFGALALASFLVGLAVVVLMPGLMRRPPRQAEPDAVDTVETITLERSAYRTMGEGGGPVTPLLRGPAPGSRPARRP